MRKLFRAPLAWMIVAECALVGALMLVAWHTIASSSAPPAEAPLVFPPPASSPAETALPAMGMPLSGANRARQLPGLNLGVGFWRVRLGSLNRDQAAFEALEWRLTRAITQAARDYLETVVIPAVRRAEGGAA